MNGMHHVKWLVCKHVRQVYKYYFVTVPYWGTNVTRWEKYAARPDSNPGPLAYRAIALPTERSGLLTQIAYHCRIREYLFLIICIKNAVKLVINLILPDKQAICRQCSS